MNYASVILSNRAHWLVKLRWIAGICVVVVVWLTSSVLEVVPYPLPLYIVAGAMLVYNLLFEIWEHINKLRNRNLDLNILLQMILDQFALILLLYFTHVPNNPFIFYFIFHMIIAALLLRGWAPYFLAGSASLLVGAIMILEYAGWIPIYGLNFSSVGGDTVKAPEIHSAYYLIGFFVAFTSTLWITVYFTSSVHTYVHRVQAVFRQKEKMLGIGQLVAGIAHQISNPLDGIQNCLATIGKGVKNDEHLAHYVKLMTEALDRIERTTRRVQSFARPHGLKLQSTDVNKAVEATLLILGASTDPAVEIVTDTGKVPAVLGDSYLLQEVIFNLCMNAFAAMPEGGTLSIRTYQVDTNTFTTNTEVAIEVTDTGVGIPEELLDKIFEPFFTTRPEAGGTGLGLGLCRMLISEMGGRLEVESTVGIKTTFRIILNVPGTKQARAIDEDTGR